MTTIKKTFPFSLALALGLTLIWILVPETKTVSAQTSISRTITDPVGNTEIWEYQKNLGVFKLLSKTSNVDNKGIVNQYDANNNRVSRTDAEGKVTTTTYNTQNQKTGMTEASGTANARTTTYEYYSTDIDLITRMVEPSVARGSYIRETLTTYDSGLNPTYVTVNGYQPDGTAISRSTSYTYNNIGQVVLIDGPRTDISDITSLTYNECNIGGGCGQLASVMDAAGNFTTYDNYDAGGLLLQSTDANGTQTNYTYDTRQRVTQVGVYPATGGTRTTRYTYDNVGQVLSVTLPDGLVITNTYNAARYLTSVTDNQGNKIEYSYDLKGNRTQTQTKDSSGSLERSLITAYDHRDQVIQINTSGSITQMVKDAVGNLTSQTDPNNNPATSNSYDALDRLNQYIDAIGGSTSYSYDIQNQLVQVTSPNGATTSYQYDDLGNLLSEVSPDRGNSTYSHDEAGNALTATDARGVVATYGYDVLNRLTTVDYLGTEEDVSYVYDTCTNGYGRLCQITDQSGVTDYEYDGFGNITTHSKTELNETYVTAYEYDQANRITKITYPFEREITYTRNNIGRITTVSASEVTNDLIYNRSYRADGQVKEQYFGNGIIETRSYDSQGRLLQQQIDDIETIDYSYDANSNLTTLDKGDGTTTTDNWGYDYDALDRLIADLKGDPQDSTDDTNYSYDGNGNRLTKNTINYNYSTNSNRMSVNNGANLAYDAAGNLTSGLSGKGYIYNLAGRLNEVQENSTTVATYTYNANGQRTRKVKGSTTTLYFYDLTGNLISEHETQNTYSLDTVWLDGEPIAQITAGEAEDITAELPEEDPDPPPTYTPPTAAQIAAAKKILPIIYMLLLGDDESEGEGEGEDPPEPPAPDDKVRFLHADHLNTPRIATDNGQTIVWRWEGQAFGNDSADSDPDGDGSAVIVNQRFAGQYFDLESGLYYNWNRYYDPSTGRYITSDPIGLRGGVNTYSYVMNRPLYYSDPMGLFAGFISGEISGGSHGIGAMTGVITVVCTDDCDEFRVLHFIKTCVGISTPGRGGAIQAGLIEGLSGDRCDPDNYSGYFLEFNYGFGGRSGGCDIGISRNRFYLPSSPSGVNECGGGIGSAGASLMLCWYTQIFK